MTPEEHYEAAEQLLHTASQSHNLGTPDEGRLVAQAQVHATLALFRSKRAQSRPALPQSSAPAEPAMTAAEVASLAAAAKWAACPDRAAATAAARASFAQRWDRQVDPNNELDPDERAQLAANAKRAHYARMAEKSAEVRRAKAAARHAEPR